MSLDTLVTAIWDIAAVDTILEDLLGVPPSDRVIHGMAPDNQPFPYIAFSVGAGGEFPTYTSDTTLWPLQESVVHFLVYDYGPSTLRALQIVQRLQQLYSQRGYAVDSSSVVAARTFAARPPRMVDTRQKLVTCYAVDFPCRYCDVTCIDAVIDRYE